MQILFKALDSSHNTSIHIYIFFFIYVLDNNFRSDEENELDPMPQCAFTRRL